MSSKRRKKEGTSEEEKYQKARVVREREVKHTERESRCNMIELGEQHSDTQGHSSLESRDARAHLNQLAMFILNESR